MEKNHSTTLLTWGILLVGANLRLPITMIPPLLPTIERTLGLPASMAGMLTTIPLLMFALASPLIAKMGNRRGNEWSLLIALIILLLGSLLRIDQTWLYRCANIRRNACSSQCGKSVWR